MEFKELIQQIASESLGVFARPNKKEPRNIVISFLDFDQLTHLKDRCPFKELNYRLRTYEQSIASLINFEEINKMYITREANDKTITEVINTIEQRLTAIYEGDYKAHLKHLFLDAFYGFEKELEKLHKQKIVEELEQVAFRLINIKKSLIVANEGDNQFDYVTNPYLSTATDKVTEIMKEIDGIVYQKRRD